jgi:hypothetical protein
MFAVAAVAEIGAAVSAPDPVIGAVALEADTAVAASAPAPMAFAVATVMLIPAALKA